ncbi:MAG: arginine repressor [Ruminococcaceae bacterium]|nr:arginine repressor [Oscillospiraceae bacterium]
MKKNRQNKIIELINKYCIETQDALIEKLKEEGFDVTQATASRDIRELNLVKVSVDGNTYKYAESPKDDIKISVKYKNILKETLVSADYACNMMVLKTYSGMAQAAAAAIDNMGWNEIVGSVAGDDTIIIVMRSDESAKDFYSRFNVLIGKK